MLLYSPANNGLETLWAFISASVGVCALAAGLEGWLFGRCNMIMRIMLIVGAGLTVDPGLSTDAVGFVLIAVVCLWNRKTATRPVLA